MKKMKFARAPKTEVSSYLTSGKKYSIKPVKGYEYLSPELFCITDDEGDDIACSTSGGDGHIKNGTWKLTTK